VRNLQAAGRSQATLRSYGMDLLRWFRSLRAVECRVGSGDSRRGRRCYLTCTGPWPWLLTGNSFSFLIWRWLKKSTVPLGNSGSELSHCRSVRRALAWPPAGGGPGARTVSGGLSCGVIMFRYPRSYYVDETLPAILGLATGICQPGCTAHQDRGPPLCQRPCVAGVRRRI